jgi:hypothetical protein
MRLNSIFNCNKIQLINFEILELQYRNIFLYNVI